MKLASLRSGRDGALVVVSRDLRHAVRVSTIARTLQTALDDWEVTAPRLEAVYAALNAGEAEHASCGLTPIGTSPVTAAISASKSIPSASEGNGMSSFQPRKPCEIPW